MKTLTLNSLSLNFLGWFLFLGYMSPSMAISQEIRLSIPDDDPCRNTEPFTSMAFSPDGTVIASGHGTPRMLGVKPVPGQTILWNAQTGSRLKTIPALQDGVDSVAFSADGKTLAILEASLPRGIIRLITVPEGREIRKIESPQKERSFYAFALHPEGQHLVTALVGDLSKKEHHLLILDLSTGQQIRSLAGHSGPIRSLAISPDGKLIASGSTDGTVRIWDHASGKTRQSLSFPMSDENPPKMARDNLDCWVQTVAFSPDGRLIAAGALGDKDSRVAVWETSTAKLKATWKESTQSSIQQVLFSPDGGSLATVSETTTFWDTRSFDKIRTSSGQSPMAFAKDAKRMVASENNRTAVIRQLPIPVSRP